MDWIILIIAGLFEVAFASCLSKAQMSTGSVAAGWYTGFVVALTLSLVLLMKASKTLPMGTAYPVWTGIGAVGTALIGVLVFKEPANFMRIFFIITLIGSIIGLKAVSH
jgi:quaternary ammonium compound-resistance protein SugE